MSLTKEQKRDLNQLNEYFTRIERLALANEIDLDVFMTEYREDGFAIYAAERIRIKENSIRRKQAFEKEEREKIKNSNNNQ